MPKPRPGTPFHPDESLAALLADAVDALEAIEELCPGIDSVLSTVRFVQAVLTKRVQEAGK